MLERWRAGDREAGRALLDRYYRSIERFFANKVGDAGEDLIQETFAACVAGRDRMREVTSFRSYLFAVAHNVLRVHLRDKYRHTGDVDFDELSIEDLAPGATTLIARRQEKRLLLASLRQIPVSHQVLLELHYWEQMTTAEMADAVYGRCGDADFLDGAGGPGDTCYPDGATNTWTPACDNVTPLICA